MEWTFFIKSQQSRKNIGYIKSNRVCKNGTPFLLYYYFLRIFRVLVVVDSTVAYRIYERLCKRKEDLHYTFHTYQKLHFIWLSRKVNIFIIETKYHFMMTYVIFEYFFFTLFGIFFPFNVDFCSHFFAFIKTLKHI